VARVDMDNYKSKLKVTVTLIFVYLILFEFILPINKFLPKPTILFESFLKVWEDYGLLSGIMITAGTIYFAIGLAIILLWLFRTVLIKFLLAHPDSAQILYVFKSIPVFFLIVMTAFWFDGLELAKIIFSCVVAFLSLLRVLAKELANVKAEYVTTALNTNPAKIYSEVYWKSSLPALLELSIKFQRILWLIVLTYEFVASSFGIGTILRVALQYRDFSAIIVIGILQALLIWLGTITINYTKKKIAFWES
jgi:ABC-type nitrate/sulfonate/bicarbonate transport system permease component